MNQNIQVFNNFSHQTTFIVDRSANIPCWQYVYCKIKLSLFMSNQYEQTNLQSKKLADRMRRGTGVSTILQSRESSTHYVDALQRFEKNYASFDKVKREQQKVKKQDDLQKKRLDYLERENKRWEIVQQKYAQQRERENTKKEQQILGIRRGATTNGLAYNPINLSYDQNLEGQKLKFRDDDAKVRRFVRAQNMDNRGNGKFNPLNGSDRDCIEKIVPGELFNRYEDKLGKFYEDISVRVPHSSNDSRFSPNPRNYY